MSRLDIAGLGRFGSPPYLAYDATYSVVGQLIGNGDRQDGRAATMDLAWATKRLWYILPRPKVSRVSLLTLLA